MVANLQPMQTIAESVSSLAGSGFIGNGTGLDPFLGEGRSVGTAVWTLSEVWVLCLQWLPQQAPTKAIVTALNITGVVFEN